MNLINKSSHASLDAKNNMDLNASSRIVRLMLRSLTLKASRRLDSLSRKLMEKVSLFISSAYKPNISRKPAMMFEDTS